MSWKSLTEEQRQEVRDILTLNDQMSVDEALERCHLAMAILRADSESDKIEDNQLEEEQ